MPQATQHSAPHRDSRDRLLDATGELVPQRTTWWGRAHALSSRAKVAIASVAAVLAGAAALLGNLDTIQTHFSKLSVRPLPLITVVLKNTKSDNVTVAARGDFMLWLPGPDARYRPGKYEFREQGGEIPKHLYVTVGPHAEVTVYATIMDQQTYSPILERADCDISLGIERVGRGLKFTENMPFTKEAITKYFLSIDVSED